MSEAIYTLEQMINIRNENYKAGRADERQRAIGLLEELKEFWSEKVEFEYGVVQAINADEAIAAIKGETNE